LNWSGGNFTMSGGTISANITTSATSRGGGIYSFGPATFKMSGGTISDHTTTVNGGGIYSTNGATLTLDAGTISGNRVTSDGGGVWIDDTANLDLGSGMVFSGNRAGSAFMPDDDALDGLNNNADINNTEGTPVLFKLIYDGNGHTEGSAPIDATQFNPFELVSVAEPGDLTRTDHSFLGWATSPEATVAAHVAGDSFEIEGDTTLYAVWKADAPDSGGPGDPGQRPGGAQPPAQKPLAEPTVAPGKGALPATGDTWGISVLLIATFAAGGGLLALRRLSRRRA
jgi:hypothetical protein